jgi:hypothetical protein
VDVGNSIVSDILRERTPQPYIDAGLTKKWLGTDGAPIVFSDLAGAQDYQGSSRFPKPSV